MVGNCRSSHRYLHWAICLYSFPYEVEKMSDNVKTVTITQPVDSDTEVYIEYSAKLNNDSPTSLLFTIPDVTAFELAKMSFGEVLSKIATVKVVYFYPSKNGKEKENAKLRTSKR